MKRENLKDYYFEFKGDDALKQAAPFLQTTHRVPNGVKGVTVCMLKNGSAKTNPDGILLGEPQFVGLAFCSATDDFLPLEGRRLALERAMKVARSARKLKPDSPLYGRLQRWNDRVEGIRTGTV